MPTMTRVMRAVVVLLAFASVVGAFASAVEAQSQERAVPTYNGDGVLSLAERTALNALPLSSVTAANVSDVREADLPYLDRDLRMAIVTPTTVTREPSPVVTTNLYAAHRSRAHHTWRHRNRFGRVLYWFDIEIAWTWNGRRVWDFESSVAGNGNFGWHYCYARPDGEEWIGTMHTARKRYSFGNFGHYLVSPGCVLGERILGGSVMGTYYGTAFYQNGDCCDQELARFTSAPPGREEWALAA